MDTSRLNALSTDVLIKLQEQIKIVLDSRLDTELRVGRIAEFDARGDVHKMKITKINSTTCSGISTPDSPNPGVKWRVGKSQLRVMPVEREAALPSKAPVIPHKPVTAGGGDW